MSDLISRQKAIDATWERPTYTDPLNVLTEVRDRIKELPPAQPELNSALYTDGFNDGYAQGRRDAQGTSVQPEQRWIACSERLPEEAYDEYLVSWTADELGEKYCIEILAYENEFEFDHQKDRFVGKWLLEEHMKVYTNVRVIAWQPLPEPYEGT